MGMWLSRIFWSLGFFFWGGGSYLRLAAGVARKYWRNEFYSILYCNYDSCGGSYTGSGMACLVYSL